MYNGLLDIFPRKLYNIIKNKLKDKYVTKF